MAEKQNVYFGIGVREKVGHKDNFCVFEVIKKVLLSTSLRFLLVFLQNLPCDIDKAPENNSSSHFVLFQNFMILSAIAGFHNCMR